MSQYACCTGLGACPLYRKGFAYYGDVTHRIIDIAELQASYFHLGSNNYVPMKASQDATLDADSSVILIFY